MTKIAKLFLVTIVLLLLPLSSPPQARAESIWEKVTNTFQGQGKNAVEEIVTGQGAEQTQEEVKPPSIFQRFTDWIKKFSISLPKSAKKDEGIKNPFPPKAPPPEPSLPAEKSTLPDPESAGQPISLNLSGKWLGRYTVTSPKECKGESGAWSATLAQKGNKLSGNFTSEAGSGSVAGSVSGGNANWSVGGGGSGIDFKGGSPSPNTIEGSFTGPVCDPEEAPQKTKGTFFGGRVE